MLWIKKFRYWCNFFWWRVKLSSFQFEGSSLGAVTAKDVISVTFGLYRPKSYGNNGEPISYEEVIHITFQNGSTEVVLATENNLKYAKSLSQGITNKPIFK